MKMRLQRLAPILLLLLLTFLLQGQTQPATQAAPKRFFWKVTSPTAEVYFLGSIHMATDDMYPLPPEIEKAYKDSKVIAVEADITKGDQMGMALAALQRGTYTDGDSLDKHISKETMKSLDDFWKGAGLPIDIHTMKPPLAAMLVEAAFAQKVGLDPEKGIDMHFLKQANSERKKIVELESIDAQMNLIFSVDDKIADKWLASMLKENSKEELDKTIKAWREGDDKTMAEEMTKDDKEDPDSAKMTDLMLYQRNVGMTKKADDMLKGTDKVFFIVGAAHLVGDKGVIKSLEAKGYKVERPALTNPPKP